MTAAFGHDHAVAHLGRQRVERFERRDHSYCKIDRGGVESVSRRKIGVFAYLLAVWLPSWSESGDWDRMKSITPRGYVCHRTSAPLSIDGKLDEKVWRTAAWSEPFVDIEGDRKPLPRYRTRVKMLWDEAYFYVGAELEEPHVWAKLSQHDAVIFHDNDFEVFIDPDGDNHEYYEFEINALNTSWDLFLERPYKDGGRAQNDWEIPGLKTAVHVDGRLNDSADVDRGWSIEIAFPWKALGQYAHRPAPPHDGDQWRVNFSRVEWKTDAVGGDYRKVAGLREDNWVWSPQGIIDMHRPERWGYVQFSTARPGSVKLRPDAALVAREALMEIYHAQRTFMKLQGTLGRLARRARTRRLRESPFHAAPGDHAARRRLSSERRASRGPAARALERSPGLADLAGSRGEGVGPVSSEATKGDL